VDFIYQGYQVLIHLELDLTVSLSNSDSFLQQLIKSIKLGLSRSSNFKTQVLLLKMILFSMIIVLSLFEDSESIFSL